MGKLRDKHGRMNWPDASENRGSIICGKCGRKVQDMDEHKALFHPEYREDNSTPLKLIPLSPKDSKLSEYSDEAEKGS